MNSFIDKRICRIMVLACLVLLSWTIAAVADEDYDLTKMLQVPHQSILNNESLPGTSGNTGAMRFAIPIRVAPGRAGLQPDLALVYNSSSRQSGWVGVGWSLDLGSIQRSSKQRINFDDNDAFICNGSVDLVRRSDWETNRFGALIEGDFSKYYYMGANNGWEVQTQGGRIYRYGTSSNSRLTTSAGVFKWLLDEIEDSNGNSLTVSYTNTAGDEIYPYQISYAPLGSYVRFIPESRTDNYPIYSSHSRIVPSSRLKQIQCYGNGSQAHRYVLNYDYSDHSGRSMLTSIQEYGSSTSTVIPPTNFAYTEGTTVRFSSSDKTRSSSIANETGMVNFADINGDGLTDLIKFGQNSTSVNVFLSNNSSYQFASANPSTLETATNPGGIHFGDINGDGKADCVIAQQGASAVTAQAYLGEANGDLDFAGQNLSLNLNFAPGLVQVADVNGDGLADLIQFPSTGGALVYLADAAGSGEFDGALPYNPLCRSNSTGRVFMADVNGDGMADVIQTENYYVYVHLADGYGRFDSCTAGTDLGHATDPGTLQFGDINGDGFSDLILSPSLSDLVYTYFSNGNGGFVFAGQTDTNQTSDKGYVHVADVNGDGLADLIKGPQSSNQVRLYLGDGSGSFTYLNYVNTANSGFSAVMDVNGDGLADLIKYSTQETPTSTYINLAQGLADDDIHADLLSTINNGYGVISTINYTLSTALADVHEPSTSFPNAFLPYTIDLVSAIVIDDGIGNGSITTSYDYIGAHYDIAEREFLGLGRIIRTNPNNTTLTTTFAVNDYYLKGRATAANYDDDQTADYLNTTYVWQKFDMDDGDARWVRIESEETNLRSGGSTVSSDTTYVYHYHSSDAYGHVYQTIQTGSGAGTLTTTTDYTEKGSWIWRVGGKRIQGGSTTARDITYSYDSYGNCTQERHNNNSGSDAVIDRGFDGDGNLQWEDDSNGNRTNFSYTTDNSFLSSKNFEGLTTNYYSYNQWGKPDRMQDENGGNTNYSYDVYGRLTQEDYPGPGVKTIDYDDTARPRYSVTRMNGGNDLYKYIDGLDRILQITERGTSGSHRTTRNFYDGAGRNYYTAGPFFTSGYVYTNSIPSGAPYRNIGGNFDFLNRPERIASPHDTSGEAITNISYNGFDRTVTDPDTRPTVEYRDYLGRIFAIQDANGRTTNYSYNGANDLTGVTDTLGHTTSMPHNWLGQMTVLDDPDLGHWAFTYWPNGEVHTRTDQKGQVITYDYDTRNRLQSKSYNSGEGPVALAYDSATHGNGRPYTVTKGNVTTTYNAYDDMGRVTQKTVAIDGQNYLFGYGYDAVGNLTSMTYPDGYTVTYGYHSGTRLLSSATGASPSISVNMANYSNFAKAGTIAYPSVTTSIGYFSRTGRVDSIGVPSLMAMDYTYTAAGDVVGIYDNERNLSYTYRYDNLHRLIEETAVGPFYRPAGRRIDLYYESPDEVHAPSRVMVDEQTRDLIYEDNGNLVIGYDFSRKDQLPERRLTYNAENMPLTIEYQPQGGSTATTQITYDGDGRRVKKQTGANSVIYVDETYEIRNGQPVKYVFAGDQRVARIRGSEVHYFHKDHLGSSTLVTDAAGGLLESTTYEPYGLQRPDCDPKLGNIPYTFTDQEWDSETGLYNYDARLYDPVLGRFLSADSIVQNWHDPQSLNRYAYARNNPLKYEDPDGHSFIEKIPSTIAAAVGYGGIAIAYAFSRPAIGTIWLFDKSGAAQANKGVNDAFIRIAKIQAGIAVGSAALDATGMGIGALTAKIGSKQAASGVEAAGEIVEASKSGKPGSYVPDRTLPTDKHGVPIPDADVPHTQLGRSKPKYGSEPQAREWGEGSNGNLQPKRDIDFTDHGYPNAHPDVPHQHKLTPSNPELAPKGGYQRGSGEPL